MVSAASRQPPYFAVTPWLEAETAADAHRLLTRIVNLVADSLSLLYGGELRTVGYVVQMSEGDQEPRAVVVGVGRPPWPTSQLQRLAPDNVKVPVIDAEDLYQSLARRPRAALWTSLFTPTWRTFEPAVETTLRWGERGGRDAPAHGVALAAEAHNEAWSC